MKRLSLYSETYNAKSPVSRTGARALIEQDGKILLSYLTARNEYLLPGGGLEKGETPRQCAQRECLEECGVVVEAEDPDLVIDEYYFDNHWRNYYSRARILEIADSCNDEKEKELHLAPLWFDVAKLPDLPNVMMNWDDIPNAKEGVINAVRTSHYREYAAYCLLNKKALPEIPKLLCPYISRVILDEF